jgi:hypothetical protein
VGRKAADRGRAQILTKAGELVGSTSAFLFAALSATTRATVVFIFHFFVLLYTMFYFLIGGPGLLRGLLAYLPLTDVDKQRMVEKFVSVTRATLKGTILIGGIQGLLGGLAFGAVGLDGAIFWGTVMSILSIATGHRGRRRSWPLCSFEQRGRAGPPTLLRRRASTKIGLLPSGSIYPPRLWLFIW